MTEDLSVPTWLALLALAGLLVLVLGVVWLLVSVRRTRRRTEELVAAAAGQTEALRAELEALGRRLGGESASADSAPVPQGSGVAVPEEREYVITELGYQPTDQPSTQPRPEVPAPVVPAPVFADIVMRESVIKTAALAAGLRRALSPEVRNRIRFEMKREVKRSRKERRAMLKAARRDWESRGRGEPDSTVEVAS
ncbi:hypothetical protein JK386_02775 [Nocardioides sp. zg-536]|uniref:Uncharacterized protein n=1 Tax=Nocardioides faecalis TaxID=2803858 RepID=A0A938Y7A7_9ACTN|nr:hypothetical protein [Nocardioides faecalis]MBM9458811.1 hypothetical protein [Nocardioides faecalis]QVI60223.1 hypothetical protein KG111_08035 [Nocardioides faecalis]